MSKQVSQTVYRVTELTGPARERAMLTLQRWRTEGKWYEWIYDEWDCRLTEMGFLSPELRHSGFACQGDGASFTCDLVECDVLLDWMAKHPAEHDYGLDWRTDWLRFGDLAANELYGKVERSGSRYLHYNTVRFSLETFRLPLTVGEVAAKWQDQVTKLVHSLCKALYTELYDAYYDAISDESCLATAEANDCWWTSEGRFYIDQQEENDDA